MAPSDPTHWPHPSTRPPVVLAGYDAGLAGRAMLASLTALATATALLSGGL